MKRLAVALLATCALSAAAPMSGAGAATLPACSLDGFDWRNDAVFAASRDPATRSQRIETLVCRTLSLNELGSADHRYRVLHAKVYDPRPGAEGTPGIEQSVNFFAVSRVTATGDEPVGRFLVPYDISRDAPLFDLRLTLVDREPVLSLGRDVPVAYRLTPTGIVAFDAHGWVAKAREFAVSGTAIGQVRLVDFERMAGYLAVFPANADDPRRPGSAVADSKLIKAYLAFEGGALVVRRTELVDRGEIQDVEETTSIVETEEWAKAQRRRLPAGTEPCDIAGWSVDTDTAGLNVRAEPSARGRVVGRVPPAWTVPARNGDPGETYRAEFKIAGYRDGWFLIRDITAPGADYGERYPRSRPQPYRGQGWVSARMVGAALANGGLSPGRLMQAPDAHSAVREVRRGGEPISTGDIVQRLHACSAGWGLVEVEGVRGWWKGLCSNQVTNCS